LNRLYLIVKSNNNKYLLWKCGKPIYLTYLPTELIDIITFPTPKIFHKDEKKEYNNLWKNQFYLWKTHFLFSSLYITMEIQDYNIFKLTLEESEESAMGQKKQFRFNIKQQIHSLQYKTKYFYLKNINMSRYGLCLAEAELLAEIANNYYQKYFLDIPENCFTVSLYENFTSKKKQNLNSLPQKKVTIPAFSHYELDIYQHYGLQALQNYRIVNILDNIAFQNSKIDINSLAKIVNITPKSIRKRLIPLLKMGVELPLTYLSDQWFPKARTLLFRYSKALKDFFIENTDEEKILNQLLISKMEWSHLLFNFFQFSYGNETLSDLPDPLIQQLSTLKKDIMASSRYAEYSQLYPSITITIQNNTKADKADQKDSFYNVLKHYFSFSNALITDYISFLKKEASNSNRNRKDGEIIYYAVSDNTISGTPLSNSELVPVKLAIFSQDDKNPYSHSDSPYKTSARKWNKAQRYSIQAQNQKANLSQYDLAFLLGVSISVIKNLMKKYDDKGILIPTRGNIQDIGPGISHAEKIIKLYLEGYTETEIKLKTGHSYQSIENYLKKFTKVVGLTDLGLNLNQIRMAARMTYNLAAKFREIYEKYNTGHEYEHEYQQYGWILAKIRNNFNQTVKKKKNIRRLKLL
jgi:transposase